MIRDLYGGLIRLHVLHHAGEKPLYGHWMIEELRTTDTDTNRTRNDVSIVASQP
jgi:hypothetical protein